GRWRSAAGTVDTGRATRPVVRSATVAGTRDAADPGRARRALYGRRRAREHAQQETERRGPEIGGCRLSAQRAHRDGPPPLPERHTFSGIAPGTPGEGFYPHRP